MGHRHSSGAERSTRAAGRPRDGSGAARTAPRTGPRPREPGCARPARIRSHRPDPATPDVRRPSAAVRLTFRQPLAATVSPVDVPCDRGNLTVSARSAGMDSHGRMDHPKKPRSRRLTSGQCPAHGELRGRGAWRPVQGALSRGIQSCRSSCAAGQRCGVAVDAALQMSTSRSTRRCRQRRTDVSGFRAVGVAAHGSTAGRRQGSAARRRLEAVQAVQPDRQGAKPASRAQALGP